MVAYETGILAAQSVGAEPGTVKIVSQVALVNTGTEPPYKDTYVLSSVPITAGENSYEAFIKLPIDVTSLTLSGFKIYLTSALPTGVTLKYKSDWTGGTSAFSTPIKTTSGKAVTTIPVAIPANANVTIENSLSTTKTTPFLTDYIVLQLQTTASAADGDGTLSLYVQYVDGSANTYTGILPIIYNVSSTNTSATIYNIQGIFSDFIDISGVFSNEASDGIY
jgi:hypothetical protein